MKPPAPFLTCMFTRCRSTVEADSVRSGSSAVTGLVRCKSHPRTSQSHERLGPGFSAENAQRLLPPRASPRSGEGGEAYCSVHDDEIDPDNDASTQVGHRAADGVVHVVDAIPQNREPRCDRNGVERQRSVPDDACHYRLKIVTIGHCLPSPRGEGCGQLGGFRVTRPQSLQAD